MEDYVRLMTLKIASNDPAEGQIEIDKAQLTPEVLFVDLLNTLEKMTANINTMLSHARSKLPTFDPIALQQAVDQFGDMATRRHVRKWAGKQ
jgi:2-succinyl-5-enolpyruvyl-6-hydroxy-3-cyclohexene-1-carboxylate synthase